VRSYGIVFLIIESRKNAKSKRNDETGEVHEKIGYGCAEARDCSCNAHLCRFDLRWEADLSKGMVGIITVVVCFGSVQAIAVNDAEAIEKTKTCFPLSDELEPGNKIKNIKAILDSGKCVKNEEKARVGKWLCRVTNTVGIQNNKNGNIASGNFEPETKLFFATIKEIGDGEKGEACYSFKGNFDHFTLYGTKEFNLFRDEGESSYMSHGECEKID
jgi:hypothetical protein